MDQHSKPGVLRLEAPDLRGRVVPLEELVCPAEGQHALGPPPRGKTDRQVTKMDYRPTDGLGDGAAVLAGEIPRGGSGRVVEQESGAVRHIIWRLAHRDRGAWLMVEADLVATDGSRVSRASALAAMDPGAAMDWTDRSRY